MNDHAVISFKDIHKLRSDTHLLPLEDIEVTWSKTPPPEESGEPKQLKRTDIELTSSYCWARSFAQHSRLWPRYFGEQT